MSRISDSDHRKIEATILPDCIVESHQISDAARGLRRVQITKLWRTDRVLGHGASGEVLLQSLDNDTEKKRALKVIRGLRVAQDEFQRELTAMIEFTKPKYQAAAVFVEFFGWFQNPKDHSMYLAMEYMRGGDLEANLLDLESSIETGPAVPEEDVRDITSQVLEGLKIMHAEGFAHRDLKPQNVLVVQRTPRWWIKLGDFGLAKKETEETAYRTQAGTKQYMGPELYFYVPSLSQETSEYTNAVDIWALGCIVYRILSRAVPFPSLLSLRNFCNCKEELLFEASSSIIGAEGFIRQLLAPHPADRLSASAALEHSWFINSREAKYTTASSISSIDIGSQSGYNTASHLGLQSYLLPPDTHNLSKNSSNRDAPSITLPEPRPKDKSTQQLLSTLSKPRSSHRPKFSPSQEPSSVNIRSEPRRRRNFDVTERVLEKVTENKVKDDDGKAKLSAEVDNGRQAEITLPPDRVSNSAKKKSPSHRIWFSSSDEEHDENEKTIKAKIERRETIQVESIDHAAMAQASRAGLKRRVMVDEDDTAKLPELPSSTLQLPALNTHSEEAEQRRPKLARAHVIQSDAALKETAVRLLLQYGFHIEQNNEKEEALHWAAKEGLVDVVLLLLEKGACIDAQGENGLTSLHIAAYKGHEAILQLLLEKGACIDTQSEDGSTALHFAADSGYQAVVQLLLEKGASIDAHNKKRSTALHNAAYKGHEAILQLLLEKGACTDAQNKDGLTALHFAAYKGHEAILQLLLEKGSCIDTQSEDGSTALHFAADSGHQAVVQLLFEKGASIDAQNKAGMTALHFAADSGHQAVVQLLLEKGANIEAQDRRRLTALHRAVDKGHKHIVRLLRQHVAEIKAQDKVRPSKKIPPFLYPWIGKSYPKRPRKTKT